jgi:SAM-dependent methyltransferase
MNFIVSDLNQFFSTNKATWNNKVDIHAASDLYNMESFRQGETSLMPYELSALGDVKGKSLLHLQCHFGQDTMSWSRLGAQCTGVDLSDTGIALARKLNEELHLDAQFFCCNVLDTSEHIKETFDIVFTSYGVIGWLPDLKPWGRMIAERLKKGGVFYIAEFHPIVWMYDYLSKKPIMKYAYNRKEVIYEEEKGTYADENADIESKTYCWNHGLSEVINALTEAGLHIEYLNEYDESPYDVLPDLEQVDSGMYVTKDKLYPLIFEIKATKL